MLLSLPWRLIVQDASVLLGCSLANNEIGNRHIIECIRHISKTPTALELFHIVSVALKLLARMKSLECASTCAYKALLAEISRLQRCQMLSKALTRLKPLHIVVIAVRSFLCLRRSTLPLTLISISTGLTPFIVSSYCKWKWSSPSNFFNRSP